MSNVWCLVFGARCTEFRNLIVSPLTPVCGVGLFFGFSLAFVRVRVSEFVLVLVFVPDQQRPRRFVKCELWGTRRARPSREALGVDIGLAIGI